MYGTCHFGSCNILSLSARILLQRITFIVTILCLTDFMCRCHVDAAYAGVAAMLPECAHHFDGLELVDSFCTNAHKWLLTNFDCSLLFVQDSFFLKKALALTPVFLQNTTNEYDYKVICLPSCVDSFCPRLLSAFDVWDCLWYKRLYPVWGGWYNVLN